jgi:hypothetical protein
MPNIPVSGGGGETHIRWADGQKQVYTDGGSRVDIYSNGVGRPDGPGHDHLWVNYDQQGNPTNMGGRVS